MKKAMDARIAAKKKLIPKKGFNLVGVDDYEEAGDDLYLIGNFPNEAAAKTAQAARKKKNPNEVTYIYGPSTR
jgi:hypothetical protein